MPTEAILHFDREGLIPVVTQDAASGEVLMLAYMNEQALRRTQETGLVHYWSRSRNALWLKGETSGNHQQLISIGVNCEQNSLLIKVRQRGAVCHDGFDTCFYRLLQQDGTLHVERDRVFDPELVYGRLAAIWTGHDAARVQFEAYEYLRDHDLTETSSTSSLLRAPNPATLKRVGDELGELAAVLAGEHVHKDRKSDIILESSQVVYWVYVASLSAGQTWEQIRPDVALITAVQDPSDIVLVHLLQHYAEEWNAAAQNGVGDSALAHATLSLIAQVCNAEGIDPLDVVEHDLRQLRDRSYLRDYFVTLMANAPAS